MFAATESDTFHAFEFLKATRGTAHLVPRVVSSTTLKGTGHYLGRSPKRRVGNIDVVPWLPTRTAKVQRH